MEWERGGLLVPALHRPDSACQSHGGHDLAFSGVMFGGGLVVTPVRGGHHGGSCLTVLLLALELQKKRSQTKLSPEEFML